MTRLPMQFDSAELLAPAEPAVLATVRSAVEAASFQEPSQQKLRSQ